MISKLQITNIPYNTEKWHKFRLNGIGASEVGGLMGLSQYSSPAKMFYEKAGLLDPYREDNEAMFWGRELEDKVAEIWQHCDGTDNGYMANRAENKIIRKCKKINGYVVNPDYPWLFMSLDRVINKGFPMLFSGGEMLDCEVPLECKTISDVAAKIWEAGVPPTYLAQIHQQMIIMGVDYGEIALFVFGAKRRLEVFPVKRNENFANQLIEFTKAFWYDRIVPAKEIAKKEKYLALDDQPPAGIQALEPEADSSEAYTMFMNERYKTIDQQLAGQLDDYDLIQGILWWQELIKAIGKKVDLGKNKLREIMREYTVLSFDAEGRVDWKKNAKGTRVLNIRIKDKPTEEKVNEIINKIKIK